MLDKTHIMVTTTTPIIFDTPDPVCEEHWQSLESESARRAAAIPASTVLGCLPDEALWALVDNINAMPAEKTSDYALETLQAVCKLLVGRGWWWGKARRISPQNHSIIAEQGWSVCSQCINGGVMAMYEA